MIRQHIPSAATLGLIFLIAGGSVAAMLLSTAPAQLIHPGLLAGLVVCALAADLAPISLDRYSLRLSLGLPFLAGIYVVYGGIVALTAGLGIAVVASAVLARTRRQPLQPLWFVLNLLSTVACISAAAAVGNWVGQIQPNNPMASWERALDFSLVHCLVNVCLVATLRGSLIGQKATREDRAALGILTAGLALYLAASVAVAILVTSRIPWLFLATLLPLAMLRIAVRERITMLDHYYETVVALMIMLQRAHPYTHGHLERVARLAEKVAIRLGLSSGRARLVRDAAILHDVGKIAIDEEILDKPGKLTESEFEHVKRHSAYGASILEPCRHFRELVPWIRHHHERPDGRGYPDGLVDRDIPLESKIIAVVDAFDAMVGSSAPGGKRSYREPMDIREALVELDRCSDTQFDRAVVVAFREVLLEGSL